MQDIINNDKSRKLERPITGRIQEDRIWEKWYSEDAMKSRLPQMNERDFLFWCNRDYPDQIILNNRGQKTYTVRQFESLVDKYANILCYGFKIKKGDIVCSVALSTPELVALKYACTTIGAITCHLNIMDADKLHNNKSIMEEELDMLKPKMIFVLDILENRVAKILNQDKYGNIIKVRMPLDKSVPALSSERMKISLLMLKNKFDGTTVKGVLSFGAFLSRFDSKKEPVKSIYEADLPANIAFTSGTTGQNKAVLLSHDACNALAYQQILADLELKRGIKNLALVPPFLAFWDADIIHVTLCLGAETILELSIDYDDIPKYFEKYKPGMGAWSQYLWDSLLHLPDDRLKAVSKELKGVIVGGERSERNQVDSFYKKTGVLPMAGYGSSEVNTTFSVTHKNCNVFGSAGIPLPFNNVRIVNGDYKDLTYNEAGRLLISSPCLMLGYYGRDDLTEEVLFKDENGVTWYDTRDYAYVDENGCLFVLDRDKPPVEIVTKEGKEKVRLLDIAEKIKTNRSIKICKLTEYDGYMVLHAVIDEFCGIPEETAKTSIIETVKNVLPEKYYPCVINFISTLPRTAVGKVDYVKLDEWTKDLITEVDTEQRLIIKNYAG